MHFVALVALVVIASSVPGLAAPAPNPYTAAPILYHSQLSCQCSVLSAINTNDLTVRDPRVGSQTLSLPNVTATPT
ncbi:hypothetical protein EV702DRAFT_1092440, partial [Suillus placidus]